MEYKFLTTPHIFILFSLPPYRGGILGIPRAETQWLTCYTEVSYLVSPSCIPLGQVCSVISCFPQGRWRVCSLHCYSCEISEMQKIRKKEKLGLHCDVTSLQTVNAILTVSQLCQISSRTMCVSCVCVCVSLYAPVRSFATLKCLCP